MSVRLESEIPSPCLNKDIHNLDNYFILRTNFINKQKWRSYKNYPKY